MVIIYVPEGKSFPIPNYLQLVEITKEEPKNYIIITKQKCACNSIHSISVFHKSIFIQNENLYVAGLTYYRIDCDTEEEFSTAIFWLVKSKFYTPTSKYIEYTREKTGKLEWTLKSTLSATFHTVITHTWGCVEFKLEKIPVYCLEDIVLDKHKKGPTISSVLLDSDSE